MNRRDLISGRHLGWALAGAMLAMGVGGLPAMAQDKPLVIARNMDINSLDPHRGFCDTCQIYFSAAYDTLVGLGPDNKTLTPKVASSWTVNENQTVFTFKLDPKAKFSDGTAIEAKDVKWSLERLKNLKGSPAFLMDGVKSIEAPDAQTIVISMDAPNSEFLGMVAAPYMGVINSKVAAANGASAAADAATADKAETWFLANSAGSGPFTLASYRADDELRVKRNGAYWRTAPALSEVVIKQTKDAVAQAQMLQSGAADIAMQVDGETAKTIKGGDVVVNTIPSYNYVYVALSPGAKSNAVKLTPEVREAIAAALDYKGLIEFTVGDAGRPQPSPIPNGFPGSDNLPEPKQDLARAKELLAKAGLDKGFEIDARFPNMNVYGVDLSQMMQKVQQDLAKVNIKAKLQPLTFTVWREQVSGDGIPLTAVFYAPDYYGSAQYVQYFAMIQGGPWAKRAGAANAPDIINPREGDLLKQALAAPADQQNKLYRDLALEMIKDKIIIPVVSPDMIMAHGKAIKGVRYSACCNLPLDEISRN